jgi:hypothetical protein
MMGRPLEFRFNAIRNIHPSVVSLQGETKAFDDDGNAVVLDESKIAPEIDRLKTEYENDYSRKRKEEYPSMPDQLDYIFHHGVEKWKEDMIIPVKNKYPKE